MKASFYFCGFDGLDNSDAAGAIVDKTTIEKAKNKELDHKIYLKSYDTYDFLKELGI